jgi:CBS domain-containing protein
MASAPNVIIRALRRISLPAIPFDNGRSTRRTQSPKIVVGPAEAIPVDSTIGEAIAKMVEDSMSLLVILSATEDTPIGIVKLHDVLRLQNQYQVRLHFSVPRRMSRKEVDAPLTFVHRSVSSAPASPCRLLAA